MTSWIDTVSTVMGQVDQRWDALKRAVAEHLGTHDPICIMPYRGYGTPDSLYLKGRVLQDQGIKLREEDASVWQNLRNMYRRFESDEVPGARVQVTFNEIGQEVVANSEGFFEVVIQPQVSLGGDRLWQSITLELLDPCRDPANPVQATGEIIVVTDKAQFGVISDIDDTLMRTAATDWLKMIRLAYLGNEHTRRPFDGVPEFYQALQSGALGNPGNPIFYVSSSAWNMYDLFVKFMDRHSLPPGPILLRDIELSPANLLSFGHETHKMEQIQPILERFPQLPFVLIGDTGEKDAEIYQHLVHQYPGRIWGIYLRDVIPDRVQRQQELAAIGADVCSRGCEFVVFTETTLAAQHAQTQGWISADSCELL